MVYGFSFGGGLIETTEEREPLPPAEGSGWGFAGNVLVARELLPGFALGGTLSFQQLNGLKMDYWETANVVSLAFLGPDLEAFGCSMNCVRFGGAFGVAILSAPELSDVTNSIRQYGARVDTSVVPADPNSISAGIGYDVHLAYELKVAPAWYAGLGFRILGARMWNESSFVGYSFFVDLLNY
jgi:hypothetical protein